jgi:hypothetical protein
MTVNIKVVFWDVMPYSSVDWHLHYRGASTCFFRVDCEGLWFHMGVKLGLLTLREEHRLRAFENRVLRRIFGLKRDEVTGGWRKLSFTTCILRQVQLASSSQGQ